MIQEKDIMLTIKSNFNNFRDRQGQRYIAEDLEKLCKALVTSDIVNFPVKKEMSAGYTEAIAWKIAERLVLVEDGKYLVINDISLQVTNALTDLGVKPENIYLAYGKWKKNAVPDTDPTLYLLMKQYIKANIVETFNILKLEDIFTVDIKFNGVIANPPYGKIGAQITEKIKDKVDYEQYINLLPANDYKRNSDKNLFNFQYDMISIKDGFKDAAVTTHLAVIHKTKVNNMTLDEFERSQYIDRSLDKYFEENSKRTHYAIDKIPGTGQTTKHAGIWEVQKTFIIAFRDMNHKCMGGKNSITYKWNVEESVDFDYLLTNYNTRDNRFMIAQCIFNSKEEKNNFVKFIYEGASAKFIQKLFTALNCDGTIKRNVFPKVDWTRTWTVEEILVEFGYTETEITEVLSDLENFKGMERD
jgi:hypothetical protein